MKNKNKFQIGLLVPAVGFLLMVPSGHAAEYIDLSYGSAHSGSGGEFLVTGANAAGVTWATGIAANYAASAKSGTTGFETFCIEYNEHFSPGGDYYSQPSSSAVKGGENIDDKVSVGTAYLYKMFATGSLPGYLNNAASAAALQQTLWFLEEERTSLPGGPLITNPGTWDSLLIGAFGSVYDAMQDEASYRGGAPVGASAFEVYALNLDPSNGNPLTSTWSAQDQLVYKGGGLQTPDGGSTLILLGMTLSGLTLLKRKFA